MAYIGQDIADVAVTVGQGVITATQIQDASITTADIGNDAITPNKVDDDGTGFQMGTLGLGTAVSGSHKLTVGGTATFSGNITGNLVGNVTGNLTGNVTGDVTGNLTGNVTGNISGSAATVTGAAQTAITSVGTLTGLTTSGTVTVGASNGSTEVKVNRSRMRHIDGLADASDYSHGDLYLNHISSGTIKASSQMQGVNGSASAPSYAFQNQTNMGIYRISSSAIGISTAGTEQVEIQATQTKISTPLKTTGRFTMTGDGSDNGLFLGGGWQIFDNASEAFGTAGDLIFYHGGTRVVIPDDGGLKIKQGTAGHIAKSFSLENAGDTNLAAAIFEESGSPTSGELRLYAGGSEKVYLRANSSSSNAFLLKGGIMQDITANNTGIQFRFNADTGFINRIDNNFDGASAASSYMRFKVASSSGNQQTALTLNGAGHATVEKRLYVTGNESGAFGTELYNASSTGHGAKIRGGSTGSHYALFVSNYNQTNSAFQVLADGSCTAGSRMDAPIFMTNRTSQSVSNNTWTDISGLTNLGVGCYLIHSYKPDYNPNAWAASGTVRDSGHSNCFGVFDNTSYYELRVDGSNVQVRHQLGSTFTITTSWIRIH